MNALTTAYHNVILTNLTIWVVGNDYWPHFVRRLSLARNLPAFSCLASLGTPLKWLPTWLTWALTVFSASAQIPPGERAVEW